MSGDWVKVSASPSVSPVSNMSWPASATASSASATSPTAAAAPAPSYKTLTGVPVAEQERVLLDELLYALVGVEGRWLCYNSLAAGDAAAARATPGLAVFQVARDVDPSLAQVLARILPLCDQYLTIAGFVDAASASGAGQVSQALAAAVRTLLADYLALLGQLEWQARQPAGLTLQRAWYLLQPAASTLRLLSTLAVAATSAEARGGALLNLLAVQAAGTGGGDGVAALFDYLLARAAAPFLAMLQAWIERGVVEDPAHEFMIVENTAVARERLSSEYNDAYWEQRYTLAPQHVPQFLQPVAERILTTGKYVNVVRECSANAAEPEDTDASVPLRFSHAASVYASAVDRAFTRASARLLHLLLHQHQLLARLRSLKHYFLLDQGDFLLDFLDTAYTDLVQPVSEIDSEKLQSLLELALRTSVSVQDPFHVDVSCDLLPYNLISQLLRIIHVGDGSGAPGGGAGDAPAAVLDAGAGAGSAAGASVTGLEAFTFEYAVQWPLTLVINRKALTKYQLIFRHLFHCRHVHRQLCQAWMDHKATRDLAQRSALRASYALRQRMLHFLQHFQHYMMQEVLEPAWHTLEQRLADAATVDEVLQHHGDFLDTALKRCMLTNPHLLKILTKLMSTCTIFASYLSRFTATLVLSTDPIMSPATEAVEPRDPARKLSLGARSERRQTRLSVASEHVRRIIADKGYVRTIGKFEENFNLHFKLLLNALTAYSATDADPHMLTLAARLDNNGFYADMFVSSSSSPSSL